MKILILGTGKIGTWLAENLKKEHEISVFDIRIEQALKLSGVAVFRKRSEIKNFRPQIVINAVSIQNTITAFESIVSYLPNNCILSDVRSVKGGICDYYMGCGFLFASVHPMFGPVVAGAARLRNENVIILRESCPEGIQFFQDFFKRMGLRIFAYSFDEHDRLMAYSLTLPFASSLVFAANMDEITVPGSTFKKHLEIAGGLLAEDDHLLAEILFNPYSIHQLEKVNSKLEFLKHVIRQKDLDEAKMFFEQLRNNIKGSSRGS